MIATKPAARTTKGPIACRKISPAAVTMVLALLAPSKATLLSTYVTIRDCEAIKRCVSPKESPTFYVIIPKITADRASVAAAMLSTVSELPVSA